MFTRHHEINVKDAENFTVRTVLASNSDESKTLFVITTPIQNKIHYELCAYGKVETIDSLTEAIERYNNVYGH